MSKSFDVCIRGDGVVGRTLALQLARERLRVALVTRRPSPPGEPARPDVRAYALNSASRKVLEALRVWPEASCATPVREARATLRLDAPRFELLGMTTAATVAVSAIRDQERALAALTSERGQGTVTVTGTRPAGAGQLDVWFLGAGNTSERRLPPQALIRLGGPITAPGYDFHSLVANRAAAAHAEWRVRVPFVPVSLGSWGRAPGSATLAPFVHTAWVDGKGWYPSAGAGLLTVFDLLRFDVARGRRDGRWSFYLDVSRDFWGIL